MFGRDLIFISWINRDGSGVSAVSDEMIDVMQDEYFTINNLSLSQKTYIASGFNSFVVKLKSK